MSREKECFRDVLERLDTKFPGREAISLVEACKLLDVYRDTLLEDKTFPARKLSGKWIVPIVPLARWLA